jgi:hypothetical protein
VQGLLLLLLCREERLKFLEETGFPEVEKKSQNFVFSGLSPA